MANRRKYDPTYKPYDKEWHPLDLIERMATGETNIEVLAAWNISEPTFYRWRHEHLELEDAYQLGLVQFESWFIKNRFNPMIEGKLEGRHAFMSSMAIANNKLKWKKEGDIRDSRTANITIGQINNFNQKDPKELEALILKNMDYLEYNNVLDVPSEEIKQLSNDSEPDWKNQS